MPQIGCSNDFEVALRKLYLNSLLLVSVPRLFETLVQDPAYFGLLKDWIDSLSLESGRQLLEVGSATGGLAAYLAKSGHKVTAVDSSIGMVQFAMGRSGREPVRFVCGDLASEGLVEHTQDIVLGASILNVVSDPLLFLNQAKRLLIQGGQVSFLFPTPQFTAAGISDLGKTQQLPCSSIALLQVWRSHAEKLPTSVAVNLLQAAGFVNVTTRRFMGGMVAVVNAAMPLSLADGQHDRKDLM